MDDVVVTSGARLHFGLLCTPPDHPWHYGGIGVMIDEPSWKIRVRGASSGRDMVFGATEAVQRVHRILRQIRAQHYVDHVKLVIDRLSPFHAGLGAGTQLTLSVGTAVNLMSGQPRPTDSQHLAMSLGRHRRSGIGTFGFDFGGFVIDRGRSHKGERSLERVRFPEDWRFIIVAPSYIQGMHGADEESFFGEKKYLDESSLLRIQEIIESRISVSLSSGDFRQFAEALGEYGDLVGGYFAQAQGGIYSYPDFGELSAILASSGFPGAAQSSWGPSIGVPVESESAASEALQVIEDFDVDRKLNSAVVRGMNTGALIRTCGVEGYRSFG